MSDHLLHKQIGRILGKLASKLGRSYSLYWDKACGGKRNIDLFAGQKERASKMCNPDAVLIKDDKIVLVLEIEESRSNPVRILGKFVASGLAEKCAMDENSYEFHNAPLFIQIVRASERGAKENQLTSIEQVINGKLSLFRFNYHLFLVPWDYSNEDIRRTVRSVWKLIHDKSKNL